MRVVWEIFKGDLRNATKSVVGVVVLVGLAVVPALYAWFNILGGWDPYENTDGLKVAVANEDAGYSSDLVPVDLNIGDSVVAALRANEQFDWEFMGASEAIEGVRSGECYAAIVIPQSFSADMMTLFSTDIKHSDIVYYSNQKENAIAPRVTDKGASAVQSSIDETFASTVNEVGLKTVSGLIDFMDGDAMGSYASALKHNLEFVMADLDSAASQAAAFSALIGSTSSLVETTAGIMDGSAGSSAAARGALGEAQQGLDGVSGALSGATAVVDQALAQAESGFDVIARTIDAGLESAEGQVSGVQDGFDVAMDDVRVMAEGLAKARDAVASIDPDNAVLDQLDRTIKLLEDVQAEVGDLSDGVGKTAENAAGQRRQVEGLLAEARQSLGGVRTCYQGELAARGEELRCTLAAVSDSSGRIAGDVDAVLSSLSCASGSLVGDLSSARAMLDKTTGVLAEARGSLEGALAQLEEALASGDLEQVKALIGSNPQGMASFLASPVSVDRQAVYGIANYGSSMAAFYTVLCLWVGSIILVALMKVEVSERRVASLSRPPRRWQLYIGRYGIFAVLALLQSTFACLGDLVFLGIQCEHPFLFMLAGWTTSLVFSFFVYTLVVSFGDIGKAVAVVLLVMQVAGSGGTFPIEMTSSFFQTVYPYLPFTHGIAAMHACIGGIYGSEFWVQLGLLALFLAPALLLGLVLRTPVIKLNDFVIRKLEETKIM